MNMKFIRKLPSAKQIREEIPVPENLKDVKEKRDLEIRNVFTNNDDRFILVIGPCSADHEDPVCEYVEKLAKLQEKVKDKILIIPRVYTNKPRTTGEGYKGMMHQPDPNKAPNVAEGIKAIRKLHLKVLSETHLVTADEMLYPENYTYLSDLLGYVAIGARSVEDQQHRMIVSGMNVPAGMKNPTSGNLSVMLNSVVAAQMGHDFVYAGYEVRTSGNPLAHTILRGAVDSYGRNIPNYHYEDLQLLAQSYAKRDLENPAVIIDTNHSNSMKKFAEQPRIAKEIINSRKWDSNLKKFIKGLMIESYLVEGRQDISDNNIYGKSITDPCLGWEDTENLIYYIAENV
ncbi:3-deoxy-7-phosphoheptulonate synthase [Clostridium oryzae]|uniref:Phospho-2-dehydro-3-deoxyheptonate aldolase n=1 Tax=Clostridium oryzae TaxID=1450648 RepID=A0A1V4IQW0_9CLOT|nr:3-deoxy-7-phosphoheptulonate synthase [Clostridium oryzae]OPJ62411.1 phospho-2-dehydro-3-deoxyheptonate aldolase, Phe-sensitive [Clostridium oryzae]